MKKSRITMLAAALIAASVSAFAKPVLAPVNPMSQKYSDRGAQPAKGRSGNASLEARALLGTAGTTRVELTTGSFDAPSTPAPGAIEKVQVKIFARGELVRTDNYSAGLGSGSAGFDYDGLRRGDTVQVLANVKGMDRARTDVVSFATAVVRRPDLEARDLTVPANVSPGAAVPIVGTIVETNGEMGARFDCRLYVDGAQVDEITGAWIDAGGNVACQFKARFSTPGTKQVVMRVTATSPADDDPGNDAVQRAVEVREQPFEHSEAWINGGCWDDGSWTQITITQSLVGTGQFSAPYTFDNKSFSSGCAQNSGILAYEAAQLPFAGRVRVTHSIDGVALSPLDIDIADIPADPAFPNCRWGSFDTGDIVFACTDYGFLQLMATRNSSQAYYIALGYLTPAAVPARSLYHVVLEFESPSLQRRAELDLPIWPYRLTSDGWLPWSCTFDSQSIYYWISTCETRYWDETWYSIRVSGQ